MSSDQLLKIANLWKKLESDPVGDKTTRLILLCWVLSFWSLFEFVCNLTHLHDAKNSQLSLNTSIAASFFIFVGSFFGLLLHVTKFDIERKYLRMKNTLFAKCFRIQYCFNAFACLIILGGTMYLLVCIKEIFFVSRSLTFSDVCATFAYYIQVSFLSILIGMDVIDYESKFIHFRNVHLRLALYNSTLFLSQFCSVLYWISYDTDPATMGRMNRSKRALEVAHVLIFAALSVIFIILVRPGICNCNEWVIRVPVWKIFSSVLIYIASTALLISGTSADFDGDRNPICNIASMTYYLWIFIVLNIIAIDIHVLKEKMSLLEQFSHPYLEY